MGFFLQPQADVLAGRLEGVEMLVRWRREDGRWKTPGSSCPSSKRTFISSVGSVICRWRTWPTICHDPNPPAMPERAYLEEPSMELRTINRMIPSKIRFTPTKMPTRMSDPAGHVTINNIAINTSHQ